MKCRMCGFEFDEKAVENRGCFNCGKHDGCNHPELEEEFEFIIKLKERFKRRKSTN